VSRFVDRGAIFAGWVGVGMAMTIAVSFLLVIPIEPVFWLMSPLAGLLIGYYANARADRLAGPPWRWRSSRSGGRPAATSARRRVRWESPTGS
jgi:hypothetical protein